MAKAMATKEAGLLEKAQLVSLPQQREHVLN